MALLVAAIDFGTTYSGWAFSFKHEFKENPTNVSTKRWAGGQLASLKGPTCVLIKGDGKTLEAFGYEAESKYAELAGDKCHDKYYFFHQFKMALYGRIGIERNIRIEDVTGRKSLPAKTVFALSIKYLKDDMLKMSTNQIGSAGLTLDEISWVLTVPAIWNDAAKQFMREAAEEAGIPSKNLYISLEPEAASLCCRNLPVEKNEESMGKLKTGSKYLVVDAGGGTVDFTVHEVMFDGSLKELHKASGGDWGGTKVNEAFGNLIDKICGYDAIEQLKQEDMEDYIALSQEFEIKKREIKPDQSTKVVFRIPAKLTELAEDLNKMSLHEKLAEKGFDKDIKLDRDKLKVTAGVIQELFHEPVQKTIDHMHRLLMKRSLKDCSTILLVGGFSESPILQEKVQTAFPNRKVIIPRDAGLAVLKGAVIFGHIPEAISERICKMTYGLSGTHIYQSSKCNHPPAPVRLKENGDLRCYNVFRCHVKEGAAIKLFEKLPEKIKHPSYDDQPRVSFHIYASTSPDVHFTTEKCCIKIGKLTIPIPDTSLGRKRNFGVSFMFGGTEIKVMVEDKETKEVKTMLVDFLG